jgi:hypothetical protein
MRDGARNRFDTEQKRAARPFHTENLTLYGKEAAWLFPSYY